MEGKRKGYLFSQKDKGLDLGSPYKTLLSFARSSFLCVPVTVVTLNERIFTGKATLQVEPLKG